MDLTKALATVIGTAIGFGLAGMGVGWFLGSTFSEFFRQLFASDEVDFNATEFGAGIGLANGLVWGLLIGVALVWILAWKETRLARLERDAT